MIASYLLPRLISLSTKLANLGLNVCSLKPEMYETHQVKRVLSLISTPNLRKQSQS